MFFEKNKVLLALVFAPTRCKTALGIVKAYQKMHPGVQLDELREKFNIYEINPWCKSFNPEIEKSLFIPYSMGVRDKRHWFIKDDELININGRAFCFSKFWCGDALANLKAVSLKYRIFVAYSRKGKKGHLGLIKQLHIVLVYIFRHEDIAQYTDIENKTSEAIYDIDDEIVADEEADNYFEYHNGPSRDVRGGMSDGAQQGGNGNASGAGNSTGAGDGAGKNFGMQEKEPSRDVRGGMSDGAQQGGNGNASGVGNSTGKNGGYGKKFSFHKVIPPFFPYKLFWVVLIIILLLLIFLLFSLLKGCSEEKSQNVIDTSSSNTVRIQKLEAKFNVAHFDYNSAALTNQAQSVLQQLADVMKKDSTIKIEVDGYASEEGGAAYNQKLSEERAKSAVDYLIDCGVDSSRLKFVGEGCSKPIDKTNLGVNRRTEFIIIQ